MLLQLLEKWNALPDDAGALRRYYRDENLAADLELQLARERGDSPSSLERSLYAARSYFAA